MTRARWVQPLFCKDVLDSSGNYFFWNEHRYRL
jgi:hypothetical protein